MKIGFHSHSCSRAKSILVPSNTERFLKQHHLHFPECSAISTHCSLYSIFSLFPHELFHCTLASPALFHLLIDIYFLKPIFHIVLLLHFLHTKPFFSIFCSHPGSFLHNLSLLLVYLSLFYPPTFPIFTVSPSYSFHLSTEKEDYHDEFIA